MMVLAARIRDQLKNEGFGGARRGWCIVRSTRSERDDPSIDIGGAQVADEIEGRVLAILATHDQPNGRSGRDNAKRQRGAGSGDCKEAGAVDGSLQHEFERGARRLTFCKQNQPIRINVVSRQQGGNAV